MARVVKRNNKTFAAIAPDNRIPGMLALRSIRRKAQPSLLTLLVLLPGFAGIPPLALPGSLQAEPSCGKGGLPRLHPDDQNWGKVPTALYRGVLQFGPAGGDSGGWIDVPKGYDENRAVPLLIVLPGTVDIGNVMYNAFIEMRDRERDPIWEHAIIVQLNGVGENWVDRRFWKDNTAALTHALKVLPAAYNIDRDRIAIAGWSAGAVFIGNYMTARPRLFSSAFHGVGGGLWGRAGLPAHQGCKLNVRFAIGTKDFMYKQTLSHYQWLKAQGHNATLITAEGEEHHGGVMHDNLLESYRWMIKQTRCGKIVPGSCRAKIPD